MRWIGDRESENIEDRRGGGGGLPVGIGRDRCYRCRPCRTIPRRRSEHFAGTVERDETQSQTKTRQADDGYGFIAHA
jgi:hypothetical protein